MSRISLAGIAALVGLVGLVLMPAGASDLADRSSRPASDKPLTTYERFLPLAVAGDSSVQHFLGYMFFYGEGVELNYDEAHHWFHLAAEEGDARAQKNLGLFHARAIPRIPDKFYDPEEANLWFSLLAANPENPRSSALAANSYSRFLERDISGVLRKSNRRRVGRNLYLSKCAGCHGFDGHAAYPGVPSFAAGERLEQADDILLASVLRGRGSMPSWRGRLPSQAAEQVLAYIRQEFGRRTRPAAAAQTGAEDQQLALGEKIYLRYCGGCHGFNGIAWYVNSPSFALRERLHKSDAELAHSIKNGRGAMPSWEYMLKPGQIDALIKFVRTLADTYESGIVSELRRPEQFLRFRPGGETGPNWTADDYR